MKVYNGENMILGRLGTQVAKDALLGEEVVVVNAEKVIISGRVANTILNEKAKRDRKGYPTKSAKFTRMADRFVRRAIRGMLPWDKTRGREAFKKIMCYMGIPDEFAKNDMITIEKASLKKLPILKYITVGEVCKQLGKKE